ncbi:MAG TPA: c-type cytochrome, partial [Chitinophagales bacterium]|nr:c-type cytochrome [Chitinophagales bacterium]
VYFGYYELGGGPTSLDEYNTAMEKADAEVAAYKAKHVVDVDENNILLADAAGIKAGKTIFESNCAVCHGKEAEGIVGPNLTDDYWLHGGSLNDIFKTIKYGVLEKGMTSWKDILSPTDIVDVTSYVKSLHGTKPANAKAPDGELYKEEEASAVAADSTTAAAK